MQFNIYSVRQTQTSVSYWQNLKQDLRLREKGSHEVKRLYFYGNVFIFALSLYFLDVQVHAISLFSEILIRMLVIVMD